MFAQFSELVCEHYNSGLPSNLSAGANSSHDYGLKGAKIAMASYCSELQYLTNPVTTHVQSAEQQNQDVNSLGLISARKSAESIEILNIMSGTYMVVLCQAIDLRHLEDNMNEVFKRVLAHAIKKTLYVSEEGSLLDSRFYKRELLQVVDHLPIFSYMDDPTNPSYPLLSKLQEVLVKWAIAGESGFSILRRIPVFLDELVGRLDEEVPKVRASFDRGEYWVPNIIEKCMTYPMYRFVRGELGTEILSGAKRVSPGEEIEKVYHAIREGKLGSVLKQCFAP